MILRRQWPLIAACLVLLALLAAFGVAYMRHTGGILVYALDDSYIQMAIGKNLATHGVWGVTPRGFTGAGTSLLWPPLLAAVTLVAGVHDLTPLALNILCAIALLWLAHRIISRHVHSAVHPFAALTLIIVSTPLYVVPWIGMEHTLQALLALALADAGSRYCTAGASGSRRALLWTMTAAALTVAIRYDTASVVIPVVVLVFAMRGWRPAGAIAIAAALPPLVYAFEATRHGWPALPSPVLIKHRLATVSGFGWHQVADFFGGGAMTVLVNAPFLFVLVLIAAALLMMRPKEDPSSGGSEPESRLLLLIFLGATIIHVQFGRLGWLHRYEAYLVSLGIVANVAALAHRTAAVRRTDPLLRRAAAVAMASLLVFPLLLRSVGAARETIAAGDDLYRHEYQLVRFFREYPPDGALLTGEIGVFGYWGPMDLVDPAGLATKEFIPMERSGVYDAALVARVSAARDVRVSLFGRPDGGAWRCVAEFGPDPEDRIDATFLDAKDAATADRLIEALKAFREADTMRVSSIRLAGELPAGRCPSEG